MIIMDLKKKVVQLGMSLLHMSIRMVVVQFVRKYFAEF